MREEIIFDDWVEDVETNIQDKCNQFVSDLSVLTYDLLDYFDKREGEYKKKIKQLESSLKETNKLTQELAVAAPEGMVKTKPKNKPNQINNKQSKQ